MFRRLSALSGVERLQVRILSDLHIDQNPPFTLENKNIFTIIAGDISKNTDITVNWIKSNLTNGIFIEGNHAFVKDGVPLQEVYSKLQQAFPLNSSISFLQNTYKIIENKVFVGCTLWTDFCLKLEGQIKSIEHQNLSKYIRGRYIDSRTGNILDLTPLYTIKEFKKSLNMIDWVCKKFEEKDIVVITHHCPSLKCSAPKFLNNALNPALISDLESFIQERKNIKYWICGHCHRDPLDTYIGNCRLLMNTRGYMKYNECPNFNPNFIIEM